VRSGFDVGELRLGELGAWLAKGSCGTDSGGRVVRRVRLDNEDRYEASEANDEVGGSGAGFRQLSGRHLSSLSAAIRSLSCL